MDLVLVSPPAVEPVTLDEAKGHLRVDWGEEDAYIESLISSARSYAEGFQGRAYITQSWRLTMERIGQKEPIKLYRLPIQSVTRVAFGDTQLSEDAYELRGRHLYPLESWPSSGPVSIEYVSGLGDDPGLTPLHTRQAILLIIGHWYTNREAVAVGQAATNIPMAARSLLYLDRVMPV